MAPKDQCDAQYIVLCLIYSYPLIRACAFAALPEQASWYQGCLCSTPICRGARSCLAAPVRPLVRSSESESEIRLTIIVILWLALLVPVLPDGSSLLLTASY